jgi:hypothetical protein
VLNIQTAGTTAISIDASQAVSFTNAPTVTGGTANGVAYLNGSKVLTTGSGLTWSGTALAVTGTLSATGLVSATNATASFKAIHLGTVTEFSTLNYDGISTAVVDRYDIIPAGKSYFTYVGASAITTLSSTGLAVTGSLNVTKAGGSLATFTQTSATGYGLTIIPGADTTYDAFAINNAANTLNNIKMFGNGSAYFAGNLSVGGATLTTSGTGITFPATQSASSNANTLDDYEEGTWDPLPNFSTTNGYLLGTAVGTYTKVGRLVSATFLLTFDKQTSAGIFTVTGLPFPNINTVAARSGAGIGYVQRIGAVSKVFTAFATPNASTITCYFVSQLSSGTVTDVTATDIDANTASVALTVNYQTT